MNKDNEKFIPEKYITQPTTAELATNASYELGLLVECAYEMYRKDPDNLRPALAANFPSQRYTLEHYLICSDFFGGTTTKRFYGFVVRDKNQPNSIVFAMRGTVGMEEWWDDFHIKPVPFPMGGKVEEGFYDIYKTLVALHPETNEEFTGEDLFRNFEKECTGSNSMKHSFVGHSLGSALVNFYALDTAIWKREPLNLTLTTFACPLTGNQDFVDLLERHVPNNNRIVNIPDVVPDGPPGEGYTHVNTVFFVNSHNFSNICRSIACYHSLLTYLWCLNPGNSLGLVSTCEQ